IIHAMVGFNDGGLMAHVGPPDMRHAIGFALNYPERKSLPVERLDLIKVGQLRFFDADEQRYPALRLSRQVMKGGGLWGAAFNGAKEVALDRFISGDIGFLQMAELVEAVLNKMDGQGTLPGEMNDLAQVLSVDEVAREMAGALNV
ncbi:MAG: 1-deoxy-D-xylulose-5-phosphate reductoisomerase, partial [Planktomarina sp.]